MSRPIQPWHASPFLEPNAAFGRRSPYGLQPITCTGCHPPTVDECAGSRQPALQETGFGKCHPHRFGGSLGIGPIVAVVRAHWCTRRWFATRLNLQGKVWRTVLTEEKSAG